MPYCPQCGVEAAASHHFCPGCGASLAAEAQRPTTTLGGRLEPGSAAGKRTVIGLLVGMVCVVILAAMLTGKGCSSVTGDLIAGGANPLGTLQFTPTECRSGELEGFFGVALFRQSSAYERVVVLQDAVRGKMLRVTVPGSCEAANPLACSVVDLTAASCARFDVRVEATGVEIDHVRALDGHVSVECTFPAGGVVKAELSFESCH